METILVAGCYCIMQPNLIRLLELVDDVFETRNDPSQIGFSDDDMAKMGELHEACLQEASNTDGPIAWVSVIPTSIELMTRFISEEITERELFDLTTLKTPQESVYLCSAIVLPEFRRSGVAFNLSVSAIRAMQTDNNITHVFVWPFTNEGESLALKIAHACGIPLVLRPR